MTCTKGQQQRAAVTQRGSLALGSAPPRTPHKPQQGQSTSSAGHCSILTSAWHGALVLLSQGRQRTPTGSWARITSLEFKNWDSGCEGGQEPAWEQSSGPQLPSSSPSRGALLQACTLEDSRGWIHRGCTTRNSLQSNTALEPPFSPAPHGPPPTHPQAPSEEANWTIPQCTPPSTPVYSGCSRGGFDLCCCMSCCPGRSAERNPPEKASRFNFSPAFCSSSVPIDLP